MMMKQRKIRIGLLTVASMLLLQACQQQTSEVMTNTTTTQSTASTTSQQTSDSATTSTGLDFSAIENGDYTSLVGTWQNDLGDTYTFDKTGLISDEYSLKGAFLRDDEYLEMMIVSSDQSQQLGLVFAKANQVFPTTFFADSSEDNSDANRDRFAVTTTQFESNQGFDSRVFYKVQ